MITPRLAQSPASVAAHYDELDLFYREIWGEHVHHGYWPEGRARLTSAEATEALVTLLADRLDLAPGQRVCDIGCGYGATASHLMRHYSVAVTGVTLSPVQAARSDGVADIRVQDWLDNDFPDALFDRAYAIESSEHMADKQRFFDEAFRTLRPGGRLVVCAWLARPKPGAWEVRHLLEPICREGRLPGMGSVSEYQDYAMRAGFSCLQVEQLARNVRRTWWICARRLLWRLCSDRRYQRFLLNPRHENRIFAVTILRLILALQTGAMQYALLVYARP
jgi:tocopherol O-methyltransferase